MILYHFSCPWKFWGEDWKSGYDPKTGSLTVEQPDLLPSNKQYDWEGCPAPWSVPVVWLTTSDETKPAETPNIMRLRLTVRLPSVDCRLRSYTRWARGWETALPTWAAERAHAHWWTYRGIIPARQIVDAELIRGRRGWWEEITEEATLEGVIHGSQ